MNPLDSASFDAEIDRQAAAWFGRREGGLTPEEELEFQRWLTAHPQHAAHYGQFDETWALLGELKASHASRDHADHGPSILTSTLRWWPAIALAAAAAVVFLVAPRHAPPPPAVREVMAAETGGMKKFELPDGSVARLNAGARIAVTFTAAQRHVDLIAGEAHFTVAKNPLRPFVVSARDVSVRAVGTAFNVALREKDLEVLVTEGRVAVEEARQGRSILPEASEAVLRAGQKVVVPWAAPVGRIAAVTTLPAEMAEESLAWQIRMLQFDEQPLREVVAEFNRYNQHQLVIADEALSRRAFGGTFRADNYEALVELLESRFGVVAERDGQQTILRLRKGQ